LAIADHARVFGLAIMLAVQASPGRAARYRLWHIGRFDRPDRRVTRREGYLFHLENVWFWAKMATFALMGRLPVPPTIRLRKWQAAMKVDCALVSPAKEIKPLRFYLPWEVRLIAMGAVFAATMARYTSF
jgi:putative membrane protein